MLQQYNLRNCCSSSNITTTKMSDNVSDSQREIFTQDGVMVIKTLAEHIQYMRKSGTLCIVEHGRTNRSIYVEWKPNADTIIDAEIQEKEWTVVENVEGRTRTLSCSSTFSTGSAIVLSLEEIKSFRVSQKSRHLTFYDGSSECLHSFLFQSGNCDHFVSVLKTMCKTIPSKRDRHLYVVSDINNAETQQLTKSFSELNIFQDSPTSILRFAKRLQERPYETAFEAFAKVTDFVYRSPESREIDEHEKEILSRSLTEFSSTAHDQGDYLLIDNTARLPERKNFPRGKPLTAEQWKGLQDNEGRIEDANMVKLMIFRGGLSPQLRREVWKYLLDYYPWRSSQRERSDILAQKNDEYYTMKLQWKSFTKNQEENFSEYRERKNLIEKDVARTDRNLDFYAGDNNPNLVALSDILMTYVMYNFDLGYVQGMSDLLSPILYLLGSEVDAFWCFVGFMNKVCSNFDIDQAGMKEQLSNLRFILAFIEPELCNYLDKHDSGNLFFCFRWLLVWFKRELSQEDCMRLWEVLWTGFPCQNFHLLIAVAILETEKETIIKNNYGFTDILKHINELSGKLDMSEMMNKAEGIYYQIKESKHLTDTLRIILGLPLLSDNGTNDHSTYEVYNDDVNDSQPFYSVENVRISPDEVSFDRSINANYL